MGLQLPGLGDVLNLGGNLYEGEQNRKAAKKANDRAAQLSERQMAEQREFAQHGIRWKVEDAVAAGLHPLAALGTNSPSYSPTSVNFAPEINGRGAAFAQMGQNLSRSYQATATQDERIASKLRLENMQLQNDLLRSQISSINNPNNPPMPIAGSDSFVSGQGDSGIMVVNPSSRTSSAPGRPAQEAGWRPDVSYSRTDTGLTPVIPQGISESMESEGILGVVPWMIRNRLAPNLGLGANGPPKGMLPKGFDYWRWNRFAQEWQPAKGGRRSFGRELYEKFIYGR